MDKAVKALFSDGTEEYRSPAEPSAGEKVRLRIRGLKGSIREAAVYIEGERCVLSQEKEKKILGMHLHSCRTFLMSEARALLKCKKCSDKNALNQQIEKYYKEGFDDKWAYPLPNDIFKNLDNKWDILVSFMTYCNITDVPNFNGKLLYEERTNG